jgi:hypothetical protein
MTNPTNDNPSPIERCLDRWHEYLRGGAPELLDDLLHDDCVFASPVVFTPQEGKEVTKLYLTAAGNSLGGEPRWFRHSDSEWDGRFRYIRSVREGYDAVLEFETTVDGRYVNGVDLITCDDDARILNFKVMIRPLQAINAVHEQMRATLEHMTTN